jgi:nitrite reductase/ring-hydroxylating ferredoxin subunit/uncharacterized membrane protein
MRSAASFKSHPIHPALIPFPFAFLIGALLFDVAGVLWQRPSLWITATHLTTAGIVLALVAAVPGAIDYFRSVPPESTGKKRATRHALANLSAVALYALARWLRGDPGADPGVVALGLEAVGAALLTTGAWMGGTLVNRNQIGVDHRYAQAGKWREQNVRLEPGTAVAVARADELKVNQMKLLRVNGERIVLARTEDGYVAFQDRCTHRGGALADGAMICGTVQCPWHGSQFDVHTGVVRAGPAKESITVYGVEARDGEVRLVL